MINGINLIMPMGGAGTRFGKELGYELPKPLIPLHGKPFFYWAASCAVSNMPVGYLSFIILREHTELYHMEERIHTYFPNADVIVLDQMQDGPVMTVKEGLARMQIPEAYRRRPVLVNDCDHVFYSSQFSDDALYGKLRRKNGLLTFVSHEPQFSYVRFKGRRPAGTAEKQVVSDKAICGAYLFRDPVLLEQLCLEYLKRGKGEYGEYFMSGLFNIMVSLGRKFETWTIDDHISFGTPAEYQSVSDEKYSLELKRICRDVCRDGFAELCAPLLKQYASKFGYVPDMKTCGLTRNVFYDTLLTAVRTGKEPEAFRTL